MGGRSTWRILVMLLVSLCVVAAVGCGSDDGSGSSSSSDSGSDTAAESPSAEPASDSLMGSGHAKANGDVLEIDYKGVFQDLIPKSGPLEVPGDVRYAPLGLVSPDEVTKKWRVCYFHGGLTDIFYIQGQKAAEQVTEDLGVELKFFNAEFDPTRMLDQITNSIARGECDAIVAQPLDPATVCKVLTEDAEQAKIPVVIINAAICGDDAHTEGTLAFEGFQTTPYWRLLLETGMEEFSAKGGGEMGIISAHDTWTGTIALKKLLKELEPKFPDVDVVQVLPGDFTPDSGLKAAQTLINSHPDMGALFVQYDQMTGGAVNALKAAGKKPGDIYIFSNAADHTGLQLMRDGWLAFSGLVLPMEETAHGIEAAIAHLEGKEVPPFINEGNTIVTPDGWKPSGDEIKTDSRLET
jgi:galactofuranose transport system substrate-binding protein